MRRGWLPAHEARHLSVTELGLGHLGAEGTKDTRSLRSEAEGEEEAILVLSPPPKQASSWEAKGVQGRPTFLSDSLLSALKNNFASECNSHESTKGAPPETGGWRGLLRNSGWGP